MSNNLPTSLEQESVHVIDTISAYFRNDITEKVADESIRNSFKRFASLVLDEAGERMQEECYDLVARNSEDELDFKAILSQLKNELTQPH